MSQSSRFSRTPIALALGLAFACLSLAPATATAALPDGRVYERVTPNGKHGQAALSFSGVMNGFIQWQTTSAQAPAESGGGNVYRSTRTDDGWVVSDLGTPPEPRQMDPLASQGFNRNLTAYWWRAQSDSSYHHSDLWRRFVGGSAHRIGPIDERQFIGLSDDGIRSVVATDLDLVPEDTSGPNGYALYLFDENDEPHLIGVKQDGTAIDSCGTAQPNAQAGDAYNQTSSDVETVFFISGGCDGPQHIYARLGLTTTIDASPSRHSNPPAEPGPRTFVQGTLDGSQLLFRTSEPLVDADTNGGDDLYLYDLDADVLTWVSRGADASDDLQLQGLVRATDDLSHVYFVGNGQSGGTGAAGQPNLYGWWDGEVHFVATLDAVEPFGISAWYPTPIGRQAQVTPDGNRLVFVTKARVAAGDEDDSTDVYGYDAAAGTVKQLSAGNGAHDAILADAPGPWGPGFPAVRTVSDDGEFGSFQTAEAIDLQDGNSAQDVYRWRWSDDSVRMISTGRGYPLFTRSFGVSPDGKDIYFTTVDPVFASDTDGVTDLYTARIDGRPYVAPPVMPECEGDGCRGPFSGPPSLSGLMTGGSGGGADPIAGGRGSFTLRDPSAAARRLAARRGRLGLVVSVNGRGRLTATGHARIGRSTAIVGRASRSVSRAGRYGLSLRLSKAARERLSRGGRLDLTVRVRFSGSVDVSERRLTLRRATAARRGGA